MNRVWKRGFIRFDFDRQRTNVYDNDRVFNFRENFGWLHNTKAFSLEQAAINIFIVNTREKQIIGTASRLQRFKNAGIAAVALSDGNSTFHAFVAGLIAAHEVGHVLGLPHGSANNNASNIMFPSMTVAFVGQNHGLPLRTLNRDQIERVNRRMSRSGDGAAFRIE